MRPNEELGLMLLLIPESRFRGCYPTIQYGNLQTDALLSRLGLSHVGPVIIPLSRPDDTEIDIDI